MELDRVLPRYDFSEIHSLWVPAVPAVADAAFRALTVGEVRLMAPLMWLRMLPAKLTGRDVPSLSLEMPLTDSLSEAAFSTYVDVPGEEFVFGGISQPWQLSGDMNHQDIVTAEDFRAFDVPVFVKIAANYRYEEVSGGTRVTTETRVAGTCSMAVGRFRFYWWVIRIPSGLIRRSMLAGLRRRILREASVELSSPKLYRQG